MTYNLIRELWSGSFARVDLVRDSEGLLRARKTVPTDDLPVQTLRLLRGEAGILETLEHPNIVRLLAHTEQASEPEHGGGELSLILEYLPGGDCEALLEALGSPGLREELVAGLIVQVLAALGYCHARGVVHRDVKPANMMLREAVEAGRSRVPTCKLIDFGCASTRGLERVLTEVVGSPSYSAPEILAGTPRYGPGVDVWSVGVSALELLAGALPFGDDKPQKGVRRYAKCESPEAELAQLLPAPWQELSSEAQNFVLGTLRAEPAKRLTAAEAEAHPWMGRTQASTLVAVRSVASPSRRRQSRQTTVPLRTVA